MCSCLGLTETYDLPRLLYEIGAFQISLTLPLAFRGHSMLNMLLPLDSSTMIYDFLLALAYDLTLLLSGITILHNLMGHTFDLSTSLRVKSIDAVVTVINSH